MDLILTLAPFLEGFMPNKVHLMIKFRNEQNLAIICHLNYTDVGNSKCDHIQENYVMFVHTTKKYGPMSPDPFPCRAWGLGMRLCCMQKTGGPGMYYTGGFQFHVTDDYSEKHGKGRARVEIVSILILSVQLHMTDDHSTKTREG